MERFVRTKTGSDGMAYQRKIGLKLALSATLQKRTFKLATEMTIAGKFDDVVFYLEDIKELWLIQTKHTQNPGELTSEMLFGDDKGDFALTKYLESYCKVQDDWPYEEKRKRFILSTNRKIHESLKGQISKDNNLDNLLSFDTCTEHFKLEPNTEQLNALSKKANQNFDTFCSKLKDNLQSSDLKNKCKFLLEHKTPLKQLFLKSEKQLNLKDEIPTQDFNLRTRKLFEYLKQNNCTTVFVDKKTLNDFFEGESRKQHIPPFVDETIFNNFINDLILSVSQPNDAEMSKILQKEMRVWMRNFIPPDDIGKLPSSVVIDSYKSIEEKFNAWDNVTQNADFLNLEGTQKWLDSIQIEINSLVNQLSKRSCSSLKEMQRYYINRRLSYSSKHSDSSTLKQIQFDDLKDHHFIDQLYDKLKDQKCFLLVAEPGMGKSTLWQYLAFEAQKKCPENFVFLFYMNNICANNQEIQTIEHALKIFDGHCFEESCKVFNNDANEIILFLDAFDETESNKIDMALKGIKVLMERQNIKILISSRKREQQKLEKLLKINAMSIILLNYDDQLNFLKKFWNIQDPISEDNKKRLNQVLDPFYKQSLSKSFVFLGIPLLLKMLAEIFSDSKKHCTISLSDIEKVSKNSLTVADIYDKFITKSLHLTYNKVNNKPSNTEIPRKIHGLITEWKIEHQLIALKEWLPLEICILLYGENYDSKVHKIIETIVDASEESLIIEVYDKYPRFIHQSYSEFLVADYLKEFVKRGDENGQKEIINIFHEQDVIRMFFFEMVNSEKNEKLLEFIRSIGEIAAFWACEINCKKIVEHLQQFYDYKTIRYDYYRDSLLHVAVRSNSYQTLEYLLSLSTNSNVIADESDSSTHQAAEKMLDVNVRNEYGQTPLHVAEGNDVEIFKLLISKGADIASTDKYENTILQNAAFFGAHEVIEYLIELKVDIDAKNSRGETALHLPAQLNKIETVKFLILKGANIESVDGDENTILHSAAFCGANEVLEYLIELKMDINAQNSRGQTALHLAAEASQFSLKINSEVDTIKLLISNGANIWQVDNTNNTIFHIAARHKLKKLLKYLIDQTVFDDRNPIHRAALHIATTALEAELESE
uniref:Serine/threonine-protein phosphatase 6 regulatory ankyrin repeat subunit C n=1 Tax=Culex pipiens TaxID=7175 RepID=A0A8D8BG83_CULPI